MKVEKTRFDSTLAKLLKAKPQPRERIKTKGKRGSKEAIIQPTADTKRKN